MKFVYIKNYLKIPKEEKLKFFKLVSNFSGLRLRNQKVVLSDNSLILELSDDSNIDVAVDKIKKYFSKLSEIEVCALKELLLEQDLLTLVFDENNKKRIKL
ncbi:MAG: hypothetical protein ACQERD_07735 [Campylobacterota bacterium]